MPVKVIALIVAAGRGERLGGDVPKQYQTLGGMPMLQRALDVFRSHPRVAAARAVIHPEHAGLYEKLIRQDGLLPPACGGGERRDSVRLGLESLEQEVPDAVLIHDAARPFVSAAVIDRVLDALEQGSKAAIPVIPVADTLKMVRGENVIETVDRSGFVRAQTPQGFAYPEILELHRRFAAGPPVTDDAMLAEKAGMAVRKVAGESGNEKITAAEDMRMAERRLSPVYEIRCGGGYDIHRLLAHDPATPPGKRTVRLCGVDIAHDKYLEGHSDADVGLHALVDAMLGAVGEGDIGMHFPPGEPKWRGADSRRFVLHAQHLLRQRGARVVNADITLIGERPRFSPHYEAMRRAVAEMLDIAPRRVSVKSTTMERLGAIGREEAIAAQALVTLRLPEESPDAV